MGTGGIRPLRQSQQSAAGSLGGLGGSGGRSPVAVLCLGLLVGPVGS
jgi:hypothetical protein